MCLWLCLVLPHRPLPNSIPPNSPSHISSLTMSTSMSFHKATSSESDQPQSLETPKAQIASWSLQSKPRTAGDFIHSSTLTVCCSCLFWIWIVCSHDPPFRRLGFLPLSVSFTHAHRNTNIHYGLQNKHPISLSLFFIYSFTYYSCRLPFPTVDLQFLNAAIYY